jgi:hypothetical protein
VENKLRIPSSFPFSLLPGPLIPVAKRRPTCGVYGEDF